MIQNKLFRFADQPNAFYYFKKGNSFYHWILLSNSFINFQNEKFWHLNNNKNVKNYCVANSHKVIINFKNEEFIIDTEDFIKEYNLYVRLKDILTIKNLLKIRIINKWRKKYQKKKF